MTLGKDYTIAAATIGRVKYEEREVSIRKNFNSPRDRKNVTRKFVSVEPFSFETKPSDKEMTRVGINIDEVQVQIDEVYPLLFPPSFFYFVT